MFGLLEDTNIPGELKTRINDLSQQYGPPPESVINDLNTLQQRQQSQQMGGDGGMFDSYSDKTQSQPPVGGGMFDSYSKEAQSNLRMAMVADIIGNLAGRDVGATKSVLALSDNSRKLRMQAAEGVAYDQMVSRFTPHQKKYLDTLPLSMRKMGVQQLLEQQFAPPSSPLVNNNMGDRVGVAAYGNISKFMEASGVKKEAAYNNLRESEVMLSLLNERDPKTGEYVMQTGPGQELLTRAQAFFGNAIESFGTKGMQEEWRGLKNNAARKEFYDSVSKSKTLLKAALMKGNLSEKELDFSTDTVSNLLRSRYGNILTAELSKIAEQTEYNRAVHLDNWYSDNLVKYRDNYVGLDAALRKEVNRWNEKDRVGKTGYIVDLLKRLDGERMSAEGVSGTSTAGAASSPKQPATATHNGKSYQQMIPGDEDSWELVQ